MKLIYLFMLIGLFTVGCRNVEIEQNIPDCYLTKYDSQKKLFNYYFVSRLPDPKTLKKGYPPREAFLALGTNTAFNYSCFALLGIRASPGEPVKAQEDCNYYDCCRAYWHLYTIVDSELRFLDVSINFYKALKQNEASAEGTPLDPRKDGGWFMGEIEYSYPSLKDIMKEYKDHFIREGEFQERQKHIPLYFKMDFSCDKLYRFAII